MKINDVEQFWDVVVAVRDMEGISVKDNPTWGKFYAIQDAARRLEAIGYQLQSDIRDAEIAERTKTQTKGDQK